MVRRKKAKRIIKRGSINLGRIVAIIMGATHMFPQATARITEQKWNRVLPAMMKDLNSLRANPARIIGGVLPLILYEFIRGFLPRGAKKLFTWGNKNFNI